MNAAAPQIEVVPAFAPFTEGLRLHELRLQRCTACGTVQLGRIRCDACLGATFTWIRSPGYGTVYSAAVMHRAYHPAFADALPYTVGLVELDEGPRVPAGFALDRPFLRAGVRVRLIWDHPDNPAPLCFAEDMS